MRRNLIFVLPRQHKNQVCALPTGSDLDSEYFIFMPSTLPSVEGADDMDALLQEVYRARPILKELLQEHGTKTLHTYTSQYASETSYPEERKSQARAAIVKEVRRLFGDVQAHAVDAQLRRGHVINTADHMGPVTHTWFLSTSVLMGTALPDTTAPIITLACANVSLNNTSFPRGLLFHARNENGSAEHRLSLLPSDSHAASVYGFRPYTEQEVQKIVRLLRQKSASGEVPLSVATKLREIIDAVYGSAHAHTAASFSDQMSITNQILWKRMFPGEQVPELLYLEQERIVIDLLLTHHLSGESMLSKILFDHTYTRMAITHFNEVPSCFSETLHKGTFLFWGASSDKGYRVPLWYKEGALVSPDGTCHVALTPDTLARALEARTLVPSLLTTFLILSFHHGLNCIGGFNQIYYTSAMKQAYASFLSAAGAHAEYDLLLSAHTTNTNDVTLGYLSDADSLIPAAGLDLCLYGVGTNWQHLVEDTKRMTLNDALLPGMPAFYRCTRPAQELAPRLSAITPAQITTHYGIDKKIRPLIAVHY